MAIGAAQAGVWSGWFEAAQGGRGHSNSSFFFTHGSDVCHHRLQRPGLKMARGLRLGCGVCRKRSASARGLNINVGRQAS